MGPCAKTVVTATLILPDGRRFVGRNDCLTPQPVCPRDPKGRRDDYRKCFLVCNQPVHAEEAALIDFDVATGFDEDQISGGHMHVEHHRVCDLCQTIMTSRGVSWSLGPPPPEATA